jgi:hypothetical protein
MKATTKIFYVMKSRRRQRATVPSLTRRSQLCPSARARELGTAREKQAWDHCRVHLLVWLLSDLCRHRATTAQSNWAPVPAALRNFTTGAFPGESELFSHLIQLKRRLLTASLLREKCS